MAAKKTTSRKTTSRKRAARKKAKARRKAPPKAPRPANEVDHRTGEPYSEAFLAARFQPGASGNPGGRAKGRKSIKALIEEILDEEIKVRGGGLMQGREALARAIVKGALKARPNPQMLEILTSREYPKPNIHDVRLGPGANEVVREAVGHLDAKGIKALEVALGQLGAVSGMDSKPPGDGDPVH
jgi:hypothetical protein